MNGVLLDVMLSHEAAGGGSEGFAEEALETLVVGIAGEGGGLDGEAGELLLTFGDGRVKLNVQGFEILALFDFLDGVEGQSNFAGVWNVVDVLLHIFVLEALPLMCGEGAVDS